MNRENTKYTLLISIILIITNCLYAQNTVTIGRQVWTSKNLDVTMFRNGDKIPEAKTEEEFKTYGNVHEPAWCYGANGKEKCGKLYNWYAVNDPRGIAPAGYHIPNNYEWHEMFNYLGGYLVAGGKMKSQEDWREKGNGTNSSGFSAYPLYGMISPFWSSFISVYLSENESADAYALVDNNVEVASKTYTRGQGCFVRCLKDSSSISELTESNTEPLEAINCELARKKYLEQNPDVAKAGMDAWNHYTTFGKREGRKWPTCSENSVSNSSSISELTESQKAQLAQASEYIDNGNYLSSLSILNDLVIQSPSYYPLYIYRGLCKGSTNDFDGAIKDIDLFINNSYGFETRIAMAYLFKGSSLIGLKNYDDGCKYLTLAKNSVESWISESANKLIAEYCGDAPKRIELSESQKTIYSKAIEEFEKGNLNTSLDYFNQLISESPSYFPSYILRASIKGQLHQYSQAVSDVDMFINNSVGYEPLLANAYRIKGASLIGLDKLDEGCKNLTLAINKGDAGAKNDFETLCNQKNKPTSTVSNSVCSFIFKKPILTITYVDNRTMCCYCNKHYAQYSTDESAAFTEAIAYLGEELYLHFKNSTADEQHQQQDVERFQKFVAENYSPLASFGVAFSVKLAEIIDISGETLCSKKRNVKKYKINSKFCSSECEDKCSYSQNCKCN